MKFNISYRAECGCLLRYEMELDPFFKRGKKYECTIVDSEEQKDEFIELQPTCQLHVKEANENTDSTRT